MRHFIQRIRRAAAQYNAMLERNMQAVTERNARVLTIVLKAAILVFSMVLICCFFVPVYAYMKAAYASIIVLAAACLFLLRGKRAQAGLAYRYVINAALVCYCTITSAFVSPNYICVTILACLFQLQVLYIDKNWRINAATILSAGVYLLVVCRYKIPSLVADEVVNVLSFSVFSCILGLFTRRAQVENFDMKRTLADFAYTDQLTGVANRRSFFERLARAEQSDAAPITLLAMIDVDDFKSYNDTYGHQSGDECLRRIGACLKSYETKHPVQFYRYGGEEFVAVSDAYTQERFFAMCEELREDVSRLRIENLDGSVCGVTLSIGVAVLEDTSRRKYETLLSNADKAQYAAKARGRNRTVRYEADMRAENAPDGGRLKIRRRM